jgi:multicomponent Na+:H+ antiporter subunit B
MRSPILTSAAVVLSPVIFAVSIVLLWRGHNLPGGGFIGGLTAAGAMLLHAFGKGPEASLRLVANPIRLMLLGLTFGGLAALCGWAFEGVFFQGVWLPEISLPLIGVLHLGSFLPFDIGVYLAVAGFVIHCARSLDDDYTPAEDNVDRSRGKEDSPWNS